MRLRVYLQYGLEKQKNKEKQKSGEAKRQKKQKSKEAGKQRSKEAEKQENAEKQRSRPAGKSREKQRSREAGNQNLKKTTRKKIAFLSLNPQRNRLQAPQRPSFYPGFFSIRAQVTAGPRLSTKLSHYIRVISKYYTAWPSNICPRKASNKMSVASLVLLTAIGSIGCCWLPRFLGSLGPIWWNLPGKGNPQLAGAHDGPRVRALWNFWQTFSPTLFSPGRFTTLSAGGTRTPSIQSHDPLRQFNVGLQNT